MTTLQWIVAAVLATAILRVMWIMWRTPND
jgi:hypothetical protein